MVDIEKSEGKTQGSGLGIDPEAIATRTPMDDMRTVVDGMDAREDRLLAIQMEQAVRSYREAFLVGLLGTGLTALAAIACFFESGWSDWNRDASPHLVRSESIWCSWIKMAIRRLNIVPGKWLC